MENDHTPNNPPRLEPWDAPIKRREPDAECSHCKNPFVSDEGFVSDGFNLCGVCFDRD